MKIKTQFIINLIIFGLILAVTSVSTIVTNERAEQAARLEELARTIQQEAYELSYLSNDYLLYHENQQLTRWESKFSSVSNNLSNLNVRVPEQQILVGNIRTNQQRLKAVFEEVSTTLQNISRTPEAAVDPAFMRISWSRMEVQNQGIIFDASRLANLLDVQEAGLRRAYTILLYILIGVFGAFILTIYIFTYQRTLKSISVLQAGTRMIGSGNLDYAIQIKTNDEIAELSRSFNQMTSDLKSVTASKAELEREIAERQRAEKARRASEENYRRIVESAIEGILTLNPDGKITFANEHIARMLGYAREELTGRYGPDFTYDESEKIASELRLQGYRNGISRQYELRLRRKNGTDLWALASASPIFDGDGQYIGILGIYTDISERKRTEQLKDEFIGMVSHELKTPLTVIIGALSVANMEQVAREEAQGLLKDAINGAETLANIVDNLLELSRYQSNRLVLKPVKADIKQIAQDVVKSLQSKASNHQLTIDIPKETTPVTADCVRIDRIIHNLVDNAIKYSPGGGEVAIFARPENDHLLVGVKDHGLGISKENRPKLFQSFQRLDMHDKYNIQGVGLGLRVCRILTEAHGGRIWVESEQGKGSTFYFTLPMSKQSAQ